MSLTVTSLGADVQIQYVHDFSFLSAFFLYERWIGPEISGLDIETEVYDLPHGRSAGLFALDSDIATVQIALNETVWIVQLPPNKGMHVTACDLFRAYLESPAVVKVIHNAPFEHSWFLAKLGKEIVVAPVWDTQVGEYLLAEGRNTTDNADSYTIPRKGQRLVQKLSLGDTVHRYYAVEMDKDHELRTSFRRAGTLTQRQLWYAAFDAYWVQRLYWDQMARMSEEQLRLMQQIDGPMTEAVARMVLKGVPIDRARLKTLHTAWATELQALEQTLQEIFYLPGDGDPVLTSSGKQRTKGGQKLVQLLDLNSPKQMTERLHAFGIPVQRYSSDELRRYAGYKGIKELLTYKKLKKIDSTYAEPLIRLTHPETQAIHCNFSITRTTTGRPASASPNMQNIPRPGTDAGLDLRHCFVPRAGYKWIIADMSNIELRLIAQIFNDPVMIAAFNQDKDLHCLTGAIIDSGVITSDWDTLMSLYDPFKARVDAGEKIAKDIRQSAKATNFGLGYGAGAARLQALAWAQYHLLWTLEQATELRNTWLTLYSGVRGYHRRMGSALQNAHGNYIVTNYEGRRRWVDPDSGYAEALNHPVQSCVGDMIKRAHIEVCRDLDVVMDVHDAIIVVEREEYAEAAKTRLVDAMIRAGQRYLTVVPVQVDAVITDYWSK